MIFFLKKSEIRQWAKLTEKRIFILTVLPNSWLALLLNFFPNFLVKKPQGEHLTFGVIGLLGMNDR